MKLPALIFASCLLASASLTTVTQTGIVKADGTPASGFVLIRITAACTSGRNRAEANTVMVPFTDGMFLSRFPPNDTCIPANTSYTVSWQIAGEPSRIETWVIPTSNVPVTISSIRQGDSPPLTATQPPDRAEVRPPRDSAGPVLDQMPAPSIAAVESKPIVPAEPQNLFVFVGKSVLVESSLPIDRIAVGLGDYAVASAVSSYEVLLNGKAPGATSMIIWQQGGGRLIYDVVVQPAPPLDGNRLLGVERQVRLELPGQDVHLTQEGDILFLRGRVSDMTSADRAYTIASVLGKTVNLLYVDIPAAEPQILLKVKFASVDRNDSNVLGLNLFSTGAGNTLGSLSTQQFSPPGVSPGVKGGGGLTLSDALNLFLFRPDLNLGATIKALETKGLLEILSEPNVLAQNGQLASFLAGGEFPFPVVQGSTGGGPSAVTIQFREFGVRLTFLPTVTPRGSIILRVAPEVSALDFTNGLSVNGFNVPALTVRKLNTVVELNPGQSFAIGGLLDDRVTDTFEKVPFLGDIPVLGKFFQSRSRNKTNTELLVIVTPEILQPIPHGQPIPGLNYPSPFLPPNTPGGIGRPGNGGGAAVDPANPGLAIPVETLIKSLQKDVPNQAMQSLQPQPPGQTPPVAGPPKQ